MGTQPMERAELDAIIVSDTNRERGGFNNEVNTFPGGELGEDLVEHQEDDLHRHGGAGAIPRLQPVEVAPITTSSRVNSSQEAGTSNLHHRSDVMRGEEQAEHMSIQKSFVKIMRV